MYSNLTLPFRSPPFPCDPSPSAQVPYVIVCIAAVVDINATKNADEWAIGQYDIASLWGATTENATTWGKKNEVREEGGL